MRCARRREDEKDIRRAVVTQHRKCAGRLVVFNIENIDCARTL